MVGVRRSATKPTGPRRGSIFLVSLDPTRGSEIQKTRPCVIVSPDELNEHLRTVIIAPMTTGGHTYPWRVECEFQGQRGRVALDQLRTVDTERLVRHLGALEARAFQGVLQKLSELFAA